MSTTGRYQSVPPLEASGACNGPGRLCIKPGDGVPGPVNASSSRGSAPATPTRPATERPIAVAPCRGAVPRMRTRSVDFRRSSARLYEPWRYGDGQMPDSGNIVVAAQRDETPPRPPRWPVLIGATAVVGVALAVVGLAGEPPATDGVTDDVSSVEIGSIPSTAPTTTMPPTTTSSLSSVGSDAEVTYLSAEDLSAPDRQMNLIDIGAPPGIEIVTHLAESQGLVYAFGPSSGVGAVRRGALVSRWDGLWSEAIEIAPPSETIIAVAGGELGLVVATTQAGLMSAFAPADGSHIVRTSEDGVVWERPAEDLGLLVSAVAVDRDSAWIFGREAPASIWGLVDALPAPFPELITSGDLVLRRTTPDRISVLLAAYPIEVAVFSVDELGLEPFDASDLFEFDTITLMSSDLEKFSPRVVEFPGVLAAARDDRDVLRVLAEDGTAHALSDSGEWDVTRTYDVEGAERVVWFEDLPYSILTSLSGWEFTATDSAGILSRMKVTDLPPEQTVFGPLVTASGRSGAMFAWSALHAQTLGEFTLAAVEDDRDVHFEGSSGRFEVRDRDGSVLAHADVFGSGDTLALALDGRALVFTDQDGAVHATVPLDTVQAMAADLLTFGAPEPGGGLLAWDGDQWSFMAGSQMTGERPFTVSAVLGIDLGFVVATGPPGPIFTPTEPSRLWILFPNS